jgi:hypothetical protein
LHRVHVRIINQVNSCDLARIVTSFARTSGEGYTPGWFASSGRSSEIEATTGLAYLMAFEF